MESFITANDCSGVAGTAPVAYNSANQVTSFTYDSAGNVINDTVNGYAYDAEGRLCAVSQAAIYGGAQYQYIYDASGVRVGKATFTGTFPAKNTTCAAPGVATGFALQNEYLVDPDGNQVTELNTTSGMMAWAHSNVWAGSHLNATYDMDKGLAELHFHLVDPLGSRRLQTNTAGVWEETCQSLPFGDQLNCTLNPNVTTSDDATEHHFTGKERDTESGIDYFGARYYASTMGRWTSPDPLPWLDWQHPPEGASDEERQESLQKFRDWISNPQHLDMYAYVLNNPLRFTDPDGEAELDKKQVEQIIQNAQKASSNPGQLAANVLKALPDNASVSGATLNAALKDTGVKLEGAVGAALSNATSISKSGDTVQIQSQSATAVNMGGTKVNFGSTVTFKVGVENGNPTLSNITGVTATKGFTATVTKLEIGQSKAVATYKFMGTHTMDIPY